MTIENWILSIIPSWLLLLLAWFAKRQFGSWLFPAALFSLYWALFLLTSLMLAPDFYFWPGAAWFILFFGLSVHAGAQLGYGIGKLNAHGMRHNGPRVYKLLWARGILIACTALGFLCVFVTLRSRGYSLSVLLHPDLLPKLSRDFSIARYGESYNPPFVSRLLTTFVYLGSMFSGVWLGINPKASLWRRLFCLLPFVPACLLALIHSTRTSLLYPLIFFLGTYFATLVFQLRLIIAPKQVVYAGLLAFASVGIFIALGMLRANEIGIDLDRTRVDLLGTHAAFSQWLERERLNGREMGWGAYTVAGVFDLLGIRERKQGIYVEVVYLGPGGGYTNIYTAFRNLIDDFSLPGAIIALFVIGAVAGFSYRKVSTGSYSWLPPLSLFYIFTLWSAITSISNYNSFILAWFMFFVCLSPVGLRVLQPVSLNRKREVVHD